MSGESKQEKEILKALRESNLTDSEIKAMLKSKKPATSKVYRLGGRDVYYGVISDSHIGNKAYDSPLADLAAKTFNKEKVDFVLHGGDICDGLYTNRPGHVFELDQIGADDQVERAIEELDKIKRPIFAITGNHTWNTFFKNAGYDIGRRLEERVSNLTYLGNAEGTVELSKGVRIQLLHPDGGTAYAISYRPQKIIESLDGGSKPSIMHIGHFHKAEYIFYRNVHTFQNGTLCSQTPFMKGKNLAAHKGFWLVRAKINKMGVTQIEPKFVPAYD